MKRSNNQRVGDIIKRLMKNPKLSEKIDALDALDAWKSIIGKPLQKYILQEKIQDGILHVKLNSSVMRNELSYKKSQILEQINTKVGKEIITDILLK